MIFKRVSKQIYDSHQEPIRKPQLPNHVRARVRVGIQRQEKILKQRVLITPEKFDENRAFRRKRSSNRKNIKPCVSVKMENIWKRSFLKTMLSR